MQALIRAATAHGEHEKRHGGEYDEQWPAWYAAYMVAEQSGAESPRAASTVSTASATDNLANSRAETTRTRGKGTNSNPRRGASPGMAADCGILQVSGVELELELPPHESVMRWDRCVNRAVFSAPASPHMTSTRAFAL